MRSTSRKSSGAGDSAPAQPSPPLRSPRPHVVSPLTLIPAVTLTLTQVGARRDDASTTNPTTILTRTPTLTRWELVEMLRRFILIGVMVVVYNGSMVQLTLGTLCSAILLFFQVHA